MKIDAIIRIVAGAVCIALPSVLAASGCAKAPFDKAMLTFRFDDAFVSQLPALEELTSTGMRATVYPITGFVGTPSYMNWDDLARLASGGHEVGSHSTDHDLMLFRSAGYHDEQFLRSRETLRGRGIDAKSFAWPYGIVSPLFGGRVRRVYGNASVYPVLSKGSLNYRDADPFRIQCVTPRKADEFGGYLEQAVRSRAWMVACFHRIGDGGGRFTLEATEFARMVKLAQDYRGKGQVDIVTVSEGAERLAGESR